MLPDPHAAPSPAPPQTPFLDSGIALTFVAAHTKSLKLGTGIVILPQRNPLVLAKEMASLDVLSGGRLILGVASGYLHQEFAALGIPFNGRGPRTDEYIDAMRAIWTMEKPQLPGTLRRVRERRCAARARCKSRRHRSSSAARACRRIVVRSSEAAAGTGSLSTSLRRRSASPTSKPSAARSRVRPHSGGSRSASRRPQARRPTISSATAT